MNNEQQITTYIFDCFGVLCTPPISYWYSAYIKPEPGSSVFTKEFFSTLLQKLDLGEKSENEICEYLASHSNIKLSPQEIQSGIDSFTELNESLVETIRGLKERGKEIILLSNGHTDFFERVIYNKFPEFKGLFDDIIISSEIGLIKPSSEIYRHVLGRIKRNPHECLFIDDNKANIEGAIDLGINGYHYSSYKNFKKDLVDLLK